MDSEKEDRIVTIMGAVSASEAIAGVQKVDSSLPRKAFLGPPVQESANVDVQEVSDDLKIEFKK